MKSIGIALGGGGARGICHIAFLKALDELNIRPSIISGTSIGAIIGGFYAAGMTGLEIEEQLNSLTSKDRRDMIDPQLFNKSGILKGKGVIRFLEEHLPVKTFEELSIPLKVITSDFHHQHQVIFDKGDLITPLRASMSIPGLFKPIHYRNHLLVDGGAVNPLPFDCIRDKCSLLIAIDVSSYNIPHDDDAIPSITECINGFVQISQKILVTEKLKSIKPDIYITPTLTGISMLDFKKYHLILSLVSKEVSEFKKKLLKKSKRFYFF